MRSDISLSDPLPDIISRNCSFSWRSPKGGGGGRSLLLSQKAYCRTHLMFLTPILLYPLTLPPPFSPENSFEVQNEVNAWTLPFFPSKMATFSSSPSPCEKLQIERRTERESENPAVSCSTVSAVLPRHGSSCSSSKKDRQLKGHVDDMRKNQRKQVNGGMLEESIALV